MEDLELHMEDDDVMAHIDLDGFFGDIPEAGDVIGACSSANASSSSPESGLSWFDEIENILMKDDEDGGVVGGGIRADSSQEFCDRFLADVLVDSPGDGSAEIADVSGDKEVPGSPSSPGSSDDGGVETAKVDGANGGGEAYDPASKKIKRQLRNRDAAVRSRERKKAYVKDLEVKSKYLEGECRRLGRLLQCVMAENQALHFNLQNSACGASVAKQESAVLSEPLPLGSLFWFLCITCLFTLPPPLLLALEAVLRENAGKGNLKPLAAPRGARSEMFGSCGVQTLDKGRRYKALRTKMKAGFLLPRVLA